MPNCKKMYVEKLERLNDWVGNASVNARKEIAQTIFPELWQSYDGSTVYRGQGITQKQYKSLISGESINIRAGSSWSFHREGAEPFYEVDDSLNKPFTILIEFNPNVEEIIVNLLSVYKWLLSNTDYQRFCEDIVASRHEQEVILKSVKVSKRDIIGIRNAETGEEE